VTDRIGLHDVKEHVKDIPGEELVGLTAIISGSTGVLYLSGGLITTEQPLIVAHGGTGKQSLTAYALLAGGTTSTGVLQQVSGLGTSGYVLTSNGAGTLPTWQPVSAIGVVSGTGANGQVTYWTGTATVAGDSGFTFDSATKLLTTAGLFINGISGNGFIDLHGQGSPASAPTDNAIRLSGEDTGLVAMALRIGSSANTAASLHLDSLSDNRGFTFPDKDGTFALTSDLGTQFTGSLAATYVAFGSGANAIAGNSAFTFNSATGVVEVGDLRAFGNGVSSGYVDFHGGTNPSVPAATDMRMWTNANGLILRISGATGRITDLDTSSLTGSHAFTFPDKDGTFALLSDLGTQFTGSLGTNQVAYGSGTNAITGSANLQFTGTVLTIADPGNSGSTTFSFSASELMLTASNANHNVLALKNTNGTNSFSAMTFRDGSDVEHGAVGYGNSTSGYPFTSATYLEISQFNPVTGVVLSVAPPPFRVVQTGLLNSVTGSFNRVELTNAGLFHVNLLDSTSAPTKYLTVDSILGRFALGTNGSTASNITGLTFGTVGTSVLGVNHQSSDAGFRADAKGASHKAYYDLYEDGTKKGNFYWDISNARVEINDQNTATRINSAGGTLTLGSASSSTNIPALTASAVVLTDASKNLSSVVALTPANGGIGTTGTPTNGQIPIGNGTNFTLATISAGSNVTVTNSAGGITIASTGGTIGGTAADPNTIHGRLTLTSGTPVLTADVTAATTAYFTPWRGATMALYYSGAWTIYAVAEQSIKLTDSAQTGTMTSGTKVITGLTDTSQLVRGMKISGTSVGAASVIASIDSATQVTGTVNSTGSTTNSVTFKLVASTLYDVFAVPTSSTVYRLQFGPAWTTNTAGSGARAVTVTYANAQDGILMNDTVIASGDSNSIAAKAGRYLGTIMTTSTDGQTEESGFTTPTGSAKALVYNYYNQVGRPIIKTTPTASWTYGTANTIRQTNGDTQNQVEIVQGQAEGTIRMTGSTRAQHSANNGDILSGIGKNATNAFFSMYYGTALATNSQYMMTAPYVSDKPAIGYHYYALCEESTVAGTQSYFGGTGGPTGLKAEWPN
jgi:hypothetical protein